MKINFDKIILLLIVILGFGFRFYGINFDKYCCQHPDERAIVMFALPLTFPTSLEQFLNPESPLNPHFFAYGNMPLYLLKGASVIAGSFDPKFASYGQINLVGRAISILGDCATIILIFLLGKHLLNRKVGIAAAFIYSVSILPIQYSHFFTSDIILTMLITLTLLQVVRFYKNPSFKNAILIGVYLGLSLVTKISATPIIVSIFIALSFDFLLIFLKAPHRIGHWFPHVPKFLKKLITEGILILIGTILTFAIFQPYALIDHAEFLKQNLLQSQMTHNAYIFPYTLQYVGKIPYLYELKNIFLWGLGPIVAILSLLGLVKVLESIRRDELKKNAELIIVLVFCFAYFMVVGNFSVGFMRYLLPIYPILALLAGVALVELVRNKFVRGLIIVLATIWTLSFATIYSKENTRLAASNWMHQNIPPGSVIATEHWDDRLPLNNSDMYVYNELPMYNQPDDETKEELIRSNLAQSNYIVIASNRLYTPIQNLNDCNKYQVCFPISSKYYQDLFSGRLGFEKVAEFTSRPTIPFINIELNDDNADESFTVYDHPKIFIFKKTTN